MKLQQMNMDATVTILADKVERKGDFLLIGKCLLRNKDVKSVTVEPEPLVLGGLLGIYDSSDQFRITLETDSKKFELSYGTREEMNTAFGRIVEVVTGETV